MGHEKRGGGEAAAPPGPLSGLLFKTRAFDVRARQIELGSDDGPFVIRYELNVEHALFGRVELEFERLILFSSFSTFSRAPFTKLSKKALSGFLSRGAVSIAFL